MQKFCPHCQRTLELDQFHVRKASRDGRQRYCKPCQRQFVEKNAPNIALLAERRRAYRLANIEAVRTRERAYNEQRREQRNALARKAYSRNRLAILAQRRRSRHSTRRRHFSFTPTPSPSP